MQLDFLKKEIIKKILFNFGCCEYYSNGILKKEHITNDTISLLDEDNNKYTSNIISAKLSIEDFTFKVAAIDISSKKSEYIIAFRSDNLPIYILRLNYDDDNDDGDFFTITENGITETSNLDTFQILVGIEKLFLLNGNWEICNDFEDLKQAIISVIEIE